MGSERQDWRDSNFRYNNFNFYEKEERNFKAQLKQKRLEYLERHHQHYQELAEHLDRQVHASYREWNHQLEELRKNLLEKLEKLEKQNTILIKISDWHTERMCELDVLDFQDEFIKTD